MIQGCITRRGLLAGASAVAGAGLAPRAARANATGTPIRIGSTIALTGPLAQTGIVHKIATELFIEQLNAQNGLLGRPIEWVLLDDQSKPDLARSLYEKLLTVDKVDLIMAPYATANILAAMGVAQRYGKLYIQNTMGIPKLGTYDMQFPAGPFGPTPEKDFPELVLAALGTTPHPPKSISVVTSKFPSAQYMSMGMRDVAQKAGLPLSLYLEYEFATLDYGAIAARVKDANADFLWIGCLGLEGNNLMEALKKLDYTPRWVFQLYPAPAPVAASPDTQGTLSASFFEEHPPLSEAPGLAHFIDEFHKRATAAGVYPKVEYQAASALSGWQMLQAAVEGTNSFDDKTLAAWLRKNKVTTVIGTMRFDGLYNHGDPMLRLKQVQDKEWVLVWPKDVAKPGASIIERA